MLPEILHRWPMQLPWKVDTLYRGLEICCQLVAGNPWETYRNSTNPPKPWRIIWDPLWDPNHVTNVWPFKLSAPLMFVPSWPCDEHLPETKHVNVNVMTEEKCLFKTNNSTVPFVWNQSIFFQCKLLVILGFLRDKCSSWWLRQPLLVNVCNGIWTLPVLQWPCFLSSGFHWSSTLLMQGKHGKEWVVVEKTDNRWPDLLCFCNFV